jgi:anthranilate synthase/aminodeoxychorismate synthase-like glutamine amidotransferase
LVLLLDNFDSFTYNLVDYIKQGGSEVKVLRNDISLSEVTQYNFKGIILSPGPSTPDTAGNMREVIDYYQTRLPLLGVCLGHQSIGQYYGATVKRALKPMHGKISRIKLEDDTLFKGLPSEINVVRYHSLIIDNLPESLSVIAKSGNGEIMGIRHKYFPIWGLQFHPEAILTEFGKEMLKNFLNFKSH